MNLDDEKLDEEKKKLKTIESKVIVDYIRTSIEILLNLKMEGEQQSHNYHSGNTSHTQLSNI
jgi:hypothetical protein